MRSTIEFKPRQTVVPTDLFERYNSLSFWTDLIGSRASAIIAKPKATVSSPELSDAI